MSTWNLTSYCAELLQPVWAAYASKFDASSADRELYIEALEDAWAGRHDQRIEELQAGLNELVPDEELENFGVEESLAQNALLTLLYALDDSIGDTRAEEHAIAQLEEFADFIDQLASPSGYLDTSHQPTSTVMMIHAMLTRAHGMLDSEANAEHAREAARRDADELWRQLTKARQA